MRTRVIIILLLLMLTTVPAVRTYPLDGAATTGIRRLAGYKLVNEGKIKGSVRIPPGALLRSDQILLRLKGGNSAFDITAATPHDTYLQSRIDRMFWGRHPSYAI